MVETKLNIQKVANLRIMKDVKIDMENINYQGGDKYVLILVEKSYIERKTRKNQKDVDKNYYNSSTYNK